MNESLKDTKFAPRPLGLGNHENKKVLPREVLFKKS